MWPLVVTSAREPSALRVVKRAGVPFGVDVDASGAMVGAAGAVVGAVVRKQEDGMLVAANEIIRPSRLTLWQPAQVSGFVGEEGTMNGEACEARNGSR